MTFEIVIVTEVTFLAADGAPPMQAPFDEILVPVDPDSVDDSAVEVAHVLAEATGAAVVLVAVLDPDHEVPEHWTIRLRELVSSLAPVPAGSRIARASSVADGLTAAAGARRAVVCMSTQGPGRFRDALDLTSSSAVVHHVSCPVVLVGPHVSAAARAAMPTEIVAFVDASPTADVVVEAAVTWAAGTGSRVWIVEIIDPADAAPGDVNETSQVARLAARHARDGVEVEWEVLHAKDPATEAARYLADDHPAALAIAGSHGRSGWQELRLGSTCMKLAHASPVPVVVVPSRRG